MGKTRKVRVYKKGGNKPCFECGGNVFQQGGPCFEQMMWPQVINISTRRSKKWVCLQITDDATTWSRTNDARTTTSNSNPC